MRKSVLLAMFLALPALVFEDACAEPRGPFTPVSVAAVGLQSSDATVRPAAPFTVPPQRADLPVRRMQVAGRCGSSNTYCNSPGFTYCCGTPGNYYCAKDVNGCTR